MGRACSTVQYDEWILLVAFNCFCGICIYILSLLVSAATGGSESSAAGGRLESTLSLEE